MSRMFNRLAIRYEGRLPIDDARDGLGLLDYEISLQSGPFRPAKPGEDLFTARAWLEEHGFQIVDRKRHHIGRHYNPTTWTETWVLNPLPQAVPTPDQLVTISWSS